MVHKAWYKKIFFIFIFFILIMAVLILLTACRPQALPNEVDELVDPQILSAPTAGNIIVGQSIKESKLTGKFSVDGDLSLDNTQFVADENGDYSFTWTFVPMEPERYNKLHGVVTVTVYDYKLSFEENGGYEIEDIYFNKRYVLEEKILTAKNDFRFDGWSETNDLENKENIYLEDQYINYPYSISECKTLYAGYRFHSADKLYYGWYNTPNKVQMRAEANWGLLYPDLKDNYVIFHPYDPPVAGSISGEVIVADMHNDEFVWGVTNFGHTNITGIVLPNFIEQIGAGAFRQCQQLKMDFIIPKTVIEIGESAFQNCHALKKVEFEAGDTMIDEISSRIFYASGIEEVALHRVTEIGYWMFAFTELKSIVISDEVTLIRQSAFAGSALGEITIEGNALEQVDGYAFNACLIRTVTFPPKTRISPDAFKGSLLLKNIDITDDQINWIAQDLHQAFIGGNGNIAVNVIRDKIYGGLAYEGEYIAGTETINLRFDTFSLQVLDALIHEFFHHYQYVLTYGIGEEDFYSVPIRVEKYVYTNMMNQPPYIIVANDTVLIDDAHPEEGYLYQWYVRGCDVSNWPYILVDEIMLDTWRQDYIPLLPDESNWEEYWNQPFEADARGFASLFSGLQWD